MCFGTVTERENSLEIDTRLVDTETSGILAAVDVYGEGEDINDLKFLCSKLDLKLTEELPLVNGMVVKADGKRIYVDLGKKTQVKNGMKLIVYHMVDNKYIEKLGEARIKSVEKDISFAELIDNVDKKAILPKHSVITR